MQCKSILICGFGGQGVVAAGKAIAFAGLNDGKCVSMLPSYGPEMRGGAANCSVIISDSQILSPVVSKFDIGIIMSGPALEKFEDKIKPGGVLIVDSYLINKKPSRKDITIIEIPAAQIAETIGSTKFANVIMIGTMIRITKVISEKGMLKTIDELLSKGKEALITLEIKALNAGLNYAG